MQWFHHDSTARFSPAINELGIATRAEGIGVFWNLLEAIAQHSDTFHLKVTGFSVEIDRAFDELRVESSGVSPDLFRLAPDFNQIPRISEKVLARTTFTTRGKLARTITALVALGLIDADKGLKYNILYSPFLVRCAEGYLHQHASRRRALLPVSTKDEEAVIDIAPEISPEKKRSEEKQRKEEMRFPVVNGRRVGCPQTISQNAFMKVFTGRREGPGTMGGADESRGGRKDLERSQ